MLRRFLEERRILALLEHPGIARLLEGGVTADGLPYFAMELVEGEPLDALLRRARALRSPAGSSSSAQVCEAVSYAHQRLVVHRDLKPSNILVADDGRRSCSISASPSCSAEERDRAAHHAHAGLRHVTPEYAAPEQVRGEAVRTATDIYGVGVLLYALLAGRRPYDLNGGAVPRRRSSG